METPSESVAVATRSFAVCCCACLKMHYSQPLKHPFTSVTEVKEECEARRSHIMGFNICSSYGDGWDVSAVRSFTAFLFYSHLCVTASLAEKNVHRHQSLFLLRVLNEQHNIDLCLVSYC